MQGVVTNCTLVRVIGGVQDKVSIQADHTVGCWSTAAKYS